MRTLVLGIFASMVGVWGCQSPVAAPTPAVLSTAALPTVVSGQSVALTLKSESPNIRVIYEGLVEKVDDETIVIGNVRRITRRESGPPLRGRLPFGGRNLRNVGVGMENLPGEVALQRRDLVAIDPLQPTLPFAAEPLRVPVPGDDGVPVFGRGDNRQP